MSKAKINKRNRNIQLDVATVRELTNPRALALYAHLWTYARADGRAYPAIKQLIHDMGVTTRKPVNDAINILKDLGLVEVVPRWISKDRQISNIKTDDHIQQLPNEFVLYKWHNRIIKEKGSEQ